MKQKVKKIIIVLLLKDAFDVDIKQKEKQTPVQLLSHLWSQKSVLCLMI